MDIAIDWNSAEVKAAEGSTAPLQLTVRLDPEPDTFWLNAFATLKERRQREVREMWYANAPVFDTLTVGGVRPGSEADVRAALDEMVARANKEADRARRESGESDEREEEARRAREKDAGAMTERFRSPPE